MTEAHVFNKISLAKEQVLNCSYSNWSRLFPKYVGKTRIFKPLPQAFLNYLDSDSIRLPDEGDVKIVVNSDNEYSDWEEEALEEKHEDKKQKLAGKSSPIAGFEELDRDIRAAIKELGGSVTPKLNWSSPKDAKWILPNSSTRCYTANDVYLLLNASDHIVHDIDHAFDACDDGDDERSHTTTSPPKFDGFELVLKQWVDVNPALEFRVFVRDNAVIGVSQRDLNYYDYLDSLRETFVQIIGDFCDDHVIGTFPDADFILDVYIPRPFTKVWIIDINPFSRTTDSLLFTWHELTEIGGAKSSEGGAPPPPFELRLVTQHNVGRFAAKEHSENYVPRDIVDASLDSSAMADLAREWHKLNAKDADPSEEDDE